VVEAYRERRGKYQVWRGGGRFVCHDAGRDLEGVRAVSTRPVSLALDREADFLAVEEAAMESHDRSARPAREQETPPRAARRTGIPAAPGAGNFPPQRRATPAEPRISALA